MQVEYLSPSPEQIVTTLSVLKNSVSQDVMEILEIGLQYIRIPTRSGHFSTSYKQMRQRGNSYYIHTLYYSKRGGEDKRPVDNAISKDDIKNSPLRELALRGSSKNGAFCAYDLEVKRLGVLLLKCAGNEKKRSFLREMIKNYGSYLNKRRRLEDITYDIEKNAAIYYNLYVENLNLNNDDIEVIKGLSWEEKTNWRHCPNYCRLWVIISCISNMIDLEKE